MTDIAINLILVRHGNTFEANETPVQVGLKTNLSLTEAGKVQAENLANTLIAQKITPDVIYSGQLARQQETANIINHAFNAPLHIESALNEIDYGLWEGKSEAEIKDKWFKSHLDWLESGVWPKAIFESSLESHLAKIRTWLELLKRKHPHQTVVAVTSNGIIRLFLYFSNLNWQTLVKTKTLAQYKVNTGHYCRLTVHTEGLHVDQWNV